MCYTVLFTQDMKVKSITKHENNPVMCNSVCTDYHGSKCCVGLLHTTVGLEAKYSSIYVLTL